MMTEMLDKLAESLDFLADPTLSASSRKAIGQNAARIVAKLRAQARQLAQSEAVWHRRVEAAADALQAVAPGELGRLDLVGRINRLKAQRDAAEERCRQLAAAGQVLSAAVDQRVGAPLGTYEVARNAIGGAFANLPNRESQPTSEAELLRARLAAIQERAGDEDGIRRAIRSNFERSLAAGEGRQTYQSAGMAVAHWVLEGDAPQEAKCTCHALGTFDTGSHHGECELAIATLDAPLCVCMTGMNHTCRAKLHPCSATCTHDDARTPGHSQRVKERSAAWRAMHPHGACTCGGEGRCAWCKDAQEPMLDVRCHAPDHINCPCSWDPPAECRYPTPVMVEPATIVSDFAAMNPIAALAQKAGAKNGREVAAFKAGHEAASKDAPMREARCYDGGKRHGYATGVESMRTECWHVVQTKLREYGVHITDMLWDGLKKAIEGATP